MTKQTITSFLKFFFLGAGVSVLATQLTAQDPDLIAYDGIDYPLLKPPFPFNSLEGNNGGIGWAAPWGFRYDIAGKGAVTQFASFVTDPSTLVPPATYSGPLETVGFGAVLDPNDRPSVELARRLAAPISGAAGTRTYISFIGQRRGEPADPNAEVYQNTEVYPDGYPWPNNLYPRGAAVRLFDSTGGEILQIGHYSETGTSLSTGAVNTWEAVGGPLSKNTGGRTDKIFTELSFVVCRIDHNGDETVADSLYLWINPDLSQGENTAVADLQLPSFSVLEYNSETQTDVAVPLNISDIAWIGPWAGDGSGDRPHAEFFFDELRVGKTWESVTPGGAVTPKWGEWPLVSGNYVDTGNFLGWLEVSQDPWVWCLALNKYLYIPENFVTPSGAWVYVPIADAPPGGENTWAGYPLAEGGYVDTGTFFGWLNILGDPWAWSLTFSKYIYLPENYVAASGGWMYVSYVP